MKFDLNKIYTKASRPEHDVKYVVYTEHKGFNKTLTYEELLPPAAAGRKDIGTIRPESSVCFVNLKHRASVGSNRVLFKVDFKQRKSASLHLNLLERKRWVNLCKYYGLMPGYVGRHFIHTGNFILRFDDLSPSKIYMYLTAARYMQEYPETVRAALYLRGLGMPFYLAFLAACRCTVHNSGHSIVRSARQYAAESDPHYSSVDPTEALALKIYVKEGCKEDLTSFISYIKEGTPTSASFKIHYNLSTITRTMAWRPGLVSIKSLFSKEIKDRFKTTKFSI